MYDFWIGAKCFYSGMDLWKMKVMNGKKLFDENENEIHFLEDFNRAKRIYLQVRGHRTISLSKLNNNNYSHREPKKTIVEVREEIKEIVA